MRTTSLVLPGTLDALEPLATFVHSLAEQAGFNRHAAGRLHLAIDEVATNVITHAYSERGVTGQLFVSAEMDAEALRIHLEDTGPEYDPTRRPDPADLNLPLEQRAIGGLGIFLARHNVDAFLYERREDRNRVTFVLNRHRPA